VVGIAIRWVLVVDDNLIGTRPERIARENDLFRALLDDNGTVVPDVKATVQFKSKGDAQIVSETARPTEGGIASILIRAGFHPGTITLTASCPGLSPDSMTFASGQSARADWGRAEGP
jgi:hypothetical protein